MSGEKTSVISISSEFDSETVMPLKKIQNSVEDE
jgi:hypothetical protein